MDLFSRGIGGENGDIKWAAAVHSEPNKRGCGCEYNQSCHPD